MRSVGGCAKVLCLLLRVAYREGTTMTYDRQKMNERTAAVTADDTVAVAVGGEEDCEGGI